MKSLCLLSLLLFFWALSINLHAQIDPELTFTTYLTGLSSPVDIANAGDGTNRLFIVERSGYIRIIENDVELATPFLDITALNSCCGERGLLGLVFHPSYASNGYFYVNYTDNGGDTNISRFEVDANNPNLADPNSEVIIMEIDQPYGNHNAGDLNFGPNDGYLYIGMGDGGSGGDPQNRSQNTCCALGKMLRIDVDLDPGNLPSTGSEQAGCICGFSGTANYKVPADNPFLVDSDTLNEIWSVGLRNPWRFSFDSSNGNMWIADVGQGSWEEVHFEAANDDGLNYGWRCYEGDHPYNTSGCGPVGDYISPVFEYDHNLTNGGRSITGGYVYRGSNFPNLIGHYVVADYVSENVWTVYRDDATGVITSISHNTNNPFGISSISTFGVDESGEMYAASLGGTIYKVEDVSPLPIELGAFKGIHDNGVNQLNWTTITETTTDYFEIEKSTDGTVFHFIGRVKAAGNSLDKLSYSFGDRNEVNGKKYYRLKTMDLDGSRSYSHSISIEGATAFDVQVYPNPNEGMFSIMVNGHTTSDLQIRMYHANGELLLSQKMDRQLRKKEFNLADASKGVYIIRVETAGYSFTRKVVLK